MQKIIKNKAAAAFCALLLMTMTAGMAVGCRTKRDINEFAAINPNYPEAIDREKDWEKWLDYIEQNEVEPVFLDKLAEFAYSTAGELLPLRDKNMVHSPVSLYYALSLAYLSSGGESAKELCSLLSVSGREEAVEKAGKLYRSLYSDNEISRLRIATSLWIDKGIKLKDDFQKSATEQLYASLHPIDFSDENAGVLMGEWVMENTKGSVKPEIQIGSRQIMNIMNTIYFYDQWIDEFRESETKPGDFYMEDGGIAKTEYMNAVYGSHGYRRGEGFTSSSLGLKESGSMIFVLPDEGLSVNSLLTSPQRLKEALEGGEGHMGQVVFQVPKFTANSRCDVKAMMENMGIKGIFETGDFSQMTDDQGITISSITQDGHISVNEQGVEASAFTNIDYAGAAIPDGRADMILNRPFLYGIQSRGVWLFIGVCDNPASL